MVVEERRPSATDYLKEKHESKKLLVGNKSGLGRTTDYIPIVPFDQASGCSEVIIVFLKDTLL